MYVPKEVAEAMAEIFDDPETGLSEQALRQLMKEAFLLEMERKRQMGEAMLSGKVVPLAIHRQDGAPNRDCCLHDPSAPSLSRPESNEPKRIHRGHTPENRHPPLEVDSEKGEMAE
jgi:hypothetical protein